MNKLQKLQDFLDEVNYDYFLKEQFQAFAFTLNYALKNNIRLTLEAWNRYETYLITKLDMALKMVNEVGLENVGVMGDTFHMNIEESNMGDAIRNIGEALGRLIDSKTPAPKRK